MVLEVVGDVCYVNLLTFTLYVLTIKTNNDINTIELEGEIYDLEFKAEKKKESFFKKLFA